MFHIMMVSSSHSRSGVAVYHQLRLLLAEELGIDPSPEAEALYLDILRRDKDTKSGLSPVLR